MSLAPGDVGKREFAVNRRAASAAFFLLGKIAVVTASPPDSAPASPLPALRSSAHPRAPPSAPLPQSADMCRLLHLRQGSETRPTEEHRESSLQTNADRRAEPMSAAPEPIRRRRQEPRCFHWPALPPP